MDREDTTESKATALPPSLRQRFGHLEASLWRKESTVTGLGGAQVLLTAWLLLFLADRLVDTPALLRGLWLGLTLLGLLALALNWMRRWVWDRRQSADYARLIRRRHRSFGDRLLGAVELAESEGGGRSTALGRAAIRQIAQTAGQFEALWKIDFIQARKLGWLTAALVAPVVALAIFVPAAARNTLARFALPWLDVPRFTFVVIEDLPDQVTLPHGESFSLAGRVRYRGFWQPDLGTARFEQQAAIPTVVANGRLDVSMSGQTEPGRLVVRLGDARAVVNIVPVHRPSLKGLTARVWFPEYLSLPATNQNFPGTTLTVVEGSRVQLAVEASRDLASARLELAGREPLDLPITGARFETPRLDTGLELRGALSIQDQHGLTNPAPWKFLVRARPDEPPTVDLVGLPAEFSILETDVLPLRLLAQDDFGVKTAGVGWTRVNADATNQPITREFKLEAAGPAQRQLTNTFMFSPSVLGLPPDSVVELRAAATDHLPGREPASSLRHRVHIVGTVQHAETVRQQLEALFSQLEEVTRKEEGLAQQTGQLKNQPPEKLADAASAQKAGELARDQEQARRQMEQIAREGQKILQEALRNPVIKQQTLREWTSNLSTIEQIAKNEMQQAAGALQGAQDKPGERSQQLSKAEQQEQSALKKLQELQQQMNKGLDDLQALTLAQRLRQLGERENRVVDQLQAVISATIGLLPRELPGQYKLMNERLGGDQTQLSGESKTIRDEIGRFFDRTRKANYGEVNREMTAANVATELERLGALIQSNIAMESMQGLTAWTKQLGEWAKKLEPPEDGDGGGEGGGKPQQRDLALLKMLIEFIRLRLGEVNLHHRTRLLDDAKERQADYADAARRLAAEQRDVRHSFTRLQMQNPEDALIPPLLDTQNALRETEYVMAEPQTGPPAQAAQIRSIERLSDLINLINEQAKRQRPQQGQQSQEEQQAAREMEMLMQMAQRQMEMQLGNLPGQSPGGSTAGGGRGQAGGLNGAAGGDGGPGRTVERASGGSRQLPAEYREVLERYFKAVEEAQRK